VDIVSGFPVFDFEATKNVLAFIGATVPVIVGIRWLVKHVHMRHREDLERRILEVPEIAPPSQVSNPSAILRAITTIKRGRRTYLDASGSLAERIEMTFRSPSAPPRSGIRRFVAVLAATRACTWLRARQRYRQERAVLERLRHMRERGLVEQEFTGHWRLKRQMPFGF